MQVTFRTAAPADIDALVGLLAVLFAQEAEFQPDADAQRRGLTRLLDAPDSGVILVAELDGAVVGMVSLLYLVSTALGARVALLEDMVVSAEQRGAGIGTGLLAAAVERCRVEGCRRITLLTDGDNHRAQRLYEGAGFGRSSMGVFRMGISGAEGA